MSYHPAGYSDEEDDGSEFEFSTDYDVDQSQPYLKEQSETEESLFYKAVKVGDIDAMKIFLANGFCVDQPLIGGWSALLHACLLGLLPVIEFLIEEKANVNFNKDLLTPLMALCQSNLNDEDKLEKCLDVLLKNGANINATDRNACTALMYACRSQHLKLVRRLVESNCDINVQDAEGWSALFHAVNEGREDIVCILIEAKARFDLIDRRKRSAYELALEKGYENLAKLVCSKKEKRRLLKEKDDKLMPNKTLKDPVEELMLQLPKTHAKNTSGFSSDVSKLLLGMGLSHLCKHFEENNIQLNEFLLITDQRLKELGVRFSIHRQRIMNSNRKFHLHSWNKSSLGLRPRNEQMEVKDAVKVLCNVTKHLHVLDATMNYVRIYQSIPIRPDVFKMSENAVHQLNLINGELNAIQSLASHLKQKENVEPVDLIKPKKKSCSYFRPVASTLLIVFFLWKRKAIISYLSFKS